MAGGQGYAWVLTAFVKAGSVVGTVTVDTTLWFSFLDVWLFFGTAGDKWIAIPAWRADTLGVVILH
jgi:hypothetical protein